MEVLLDEIRACSANADTRGSPASRGGGAARSAARGALGLALQASLLVRHAPAPVADAFLSSRLDGDGGLVYGTLPPRAEAASIVERHLPRYCGLH